MTSTHWLWGALSMKACESKRYEEMNTSRAYLVWVTVGRRILGSLVLPPLALPSSPLFAHVFAATLPLVMDLKKHSHEESFEINGPSLLLLFSL
jgi:hypothetical protein